MKHKIMGKSAKIVILLLVFSIFIVLPATASNQAFNFNNVKSSAKIQFANAGDFFTNSFFKWYSLDSSGNLDSQYQTQRIMVEFLLFFLIFLSLATISMKRFMEGGSGGSENKGATKGLSIGLSLAFTLALVSYFQGKLVAAFIPLMSKIPFLLVMAVIYGLLQYFNSDAKLMNFIIALVITLVLFMMFTPLRASVFGDGSSDYDFFKGLKSNNQMRKALDKDNPKDATKVLGVKLDSMERNLERADAAKDDKRKKYYLDEAEKDLDDARKLMNGMEEEGWLIPSALEEEYNELMTTYQKQYNEEGMAIEELDYVLHVKNTTVSAGDDCNTVRLKFYKDEGKTIAEEVKGQVVRVFANSKPIDINCGRGESTYTKQIDQEAMLEISIKKDYDKISIRINNKEVRINVGESKEEPDTDTSKGNPSNTKQEPKVDDCQKAVNDIKTTDFDRIAEGYSNFKKHDCCGRLDEFSLSDKVKKRLCE